MKRMLAMTTALFVCGKCGTINAMPMADFIDPDTRYVHEIMVGCNDDTLRASDGFEYVITPGCTIHPIEYEVCVDTWCTETRTDDEIVDFCELAEVLEIHSAYVLQGGNEIVITDECTESGYIYELAETLPEYSHVYVVMNNHWSNDVTVHSIYRLADREEYIRYMEG